MVAAACGLSILASAAVKSEDARHKLRVRALSRSRLRSLIANDPVRSPIQSSGEVSGMRTSPFRSSASVRVASARLMVPRCCRLMRCRIARSRIVASWSVVRVRSVSVAASVGASRSSASLRSPAFRAVSVAMRVRESFIAALAKWVSRRKLRALRVMLSCSVVTKRLAICATTCQK
jgi:hypothetical protein